MSDAWQGPPGPYPPGLYPGPDDPLVSADYAGWWGRSLALLRTTWRPVALILLLAEIPLLLLDLLAVEPFTSVDWWEGDRVDSLAVTLPATVVTGLLLLIAQIGTVDVVVRRATGGPVSVAASVGAVLRRLPALLGWQILALLLAGVGILLCVLPGVYVVAVTLTLPVIVLLERTNVITRSFRLFHADLGASAARIGTVLGLHVGFFAVEAMLTTALDLAAGPGATVRATGSVLSSLFAVGVGVVTAPMLVTAYADMRARHEPFSTAYLTAR